METPQYYVIRTLPFFFHMEKRFETDIWCAVVKQKHQHWSYSSI